MPPKPLCKRGDVVLVLFPHSDLKTAKTRPAVVVQADALQSGMPQVIVAMISGRMFRAGYPSRIVIEKNSTTPSVIRSACSHRSRGGTALPTTLIHGPTSAGRWASRPGGGSFGGYCTLSPSSA